MKLHAYPMHAHREPPDNAWHDWTLVLFLIAALLLIGGLALLFAKGAIA